MADEHGPAVAVDCYAGHRGDETPRRFTLAGRRIEVVEIVDAWLAPDHRYFRVTGDDGSTYLLRHGGDGWELAERRFRVRSPGHHPRGQS